MRRATRLDSA